MTDNVQIGFTDQEARSAFEEINKRPESKEPTKAQQLYELSLRNGNPLPPFFRSKA